MHRRGNPGVPRFQENPVKASCFLTMDEKRQIALLSSSGGLIFRRTGLLNRKKTNCVKSLKA